jgi:hypothetical protein
MRMTPGLQAATYPPCFGCDHTDEKPRTWPGSTNYRILKSEKCRCSMGIYPAHLCPSCNPSKRRKRADAWSSTRPAPKSLEQSERMKQWHREHPHPSRIPSEDGMYRCSRCARLGREPMHPESDFAAAPTLPRKLAAWCRACAREDIAERRARKAGTPRVGGYYQGRSP